MCCRCSCDCGFTSSNMTGSDVSRLRCLPNFRRSLLYWYSISILVSVCYESSLIDFALSKSHCLSIVILATTVCVCFCVSSQTSHVFVRYRKTFLARNEKKMVTKEKNYSHIHTGMFTVQSILNRLKDKPLRYPLIGHLSEESLSRPGIPRYDLLEWLLSKFHESIPGSQQSDADLNGGDGDGDAHDTVPDVIYFNGWQKSSSKDDGNTALSNDDRERGLLRVVRVQTLLIHVSH